MSFLLHLEVPGLTDEQGLRVHSEVRGRGLWPVHFEPGRRQRFTLSGSRQVGPRLSVAEGTDQGVHLLADDAEWDAPAWSMNEDVLPSLAATIRVLGDMLTQGFEFRATWVGSPVEREVSLTAPELAELARASRLNEFTLYRVPAALGARS